MVEVKPVRWIVSPSIDLSCISLGWLLFFLLPALSPEYTEDARIIAFTFFIAHRYVTFPLVYLDRTEFRRRKWTYLTVPFLCLGGVATCYYFRIDEPEMFAFWWFFNYFHFVRQKYGILRIYSSKSKGSNKRLDELVTYGWGAAGIVHMLVHQAEIEGRLMHYLSVEPTWVYVIVVLVAAWWVIDEMGWTNGQGKGTVLALGGIFTASGLVVAALVSQPAVASMLVQSIYSVFSIVTIVWLVREFRSPGGPSWPKVLFVASVVIMYGVGPLISGAVVMISTSFSHAAEYFAVVGLAVKNKARDETADAPALVHAAKHLAVYTVLFIVAVSGLLQGMKAVLPLAFVMFTYGTSFTHYIFDGMIWKLRRPRVAHEVGAHA